MSNWIVKIPKLQKNNNNKTKKKSFDLLFEFIEFSFLIDYFWPPSFSQDIAFGYVNSRVDSTKVGEDHGIAGERCHGSPEGSARHPNSEEEEEELAFISTGDRR